MLIVNSARTLAHLSQPAKLQGARALPEQTMADRLLERLAGDLSALKADPEQLAAMRERLAPRQPLTLALRTRLGEKEQLISKLQAQLKQQAPPAPRRDADDEEGDDELYLETLSTMLPAPSDDDDDDPASRPRTPPGERPFAMDPTNASGRSFLVEAFAEEAAARAAAEAAEADCAVARAPNHKSAVSKTSARSALAVANEARVSRNNLDTHDKPPRARAAPAVTSRQPHPPSGPRKPTAPRVRSRASLAALTTRPGVALVTPHAVVAGTVAESVVTRTANEEGVTPQWPPADMPLHLPPNLPEDAPLPRMHLAAFVDESEYADEHDGKDGARGGDGGGDESGKAVSPTVDVSAGEAQATGEAQASGKPVRRARLDVKAAQARLQAAVALEDEMGMQPAAKAHMEAPPSQAHMDVEPVQLAMLTSPFRRVGAASGVLGSPRARA